MLKGVCGIVVTCLFAAPIFLEQQFGEMNIDQILFVLLSSGDGANVDIVYEYLIFVIPYVLMFIGIVLVYQFISRYTISFKIKFFNKTFHPKITFEPSLLKSVIISLCVIVGLVFFVDSHLDVAGYVSDRLNPGTMYETYYVDPESVEIRFPQEKQNLIYIVLESMNTNFSEIVVDGEVVNLIPNLQVIAEENVSFSNSAQFGGAVPMANLSWTSASLVGQTGGVELHVPIDGNSYGTSGVFLPGLMTLGEILEAQGYSNYFLMGSDANFGGRQTYFETHGNYTILDTKYLKEIGYVPEDYHVFWGIEDRKLFDYAKELLLEVSGFNEPFNVSLLTVDTHFMDGYTDVSCETPFSIDYANAIVCSDKLLDEFLGWIEDQSFYENTTVILVGDHHSMNNSFLIESVNKVFTTYNAFMNVNVDVDESEFTYRDFTVMDLFPTTLASLGVEIEGNRLGLGTNLFAHEETLPEMLGFDDLSVELAKKSLFYERNFLRLTDDE